MHTLPPIGSALLISWLLFPYLAAFSAALFPSLGPTLLLITSLLTLVVGALPLYTQAEQPLQLLGDLGISVTLDTQSSWFLLLNGLLFLAVLLDGWQRQQARSQMLLLLVLQGGLNTGFLCTDLVSLYVTLEVVGISAFLLILQTRSDRVLWVALRYLLIGNTAMTLYLIGAGLIYSQTGSFAFSSLQDLPFGAPLVFVLVGLLTKAGLFVSGLWLPRTHAESPPEISALLSGVVVTAGALPLLRLSMLHAEVAAVLQVVGLGSALLGSAYGLLANDVKRMLAWSTLSQMGLVVLSPMSGGLLALAHGLAKGALFLQARGFATRDLAQWQSTPLSWAVQLPIWVASLSIAGLPPLLGAAAKKQLEGLLMSPGSWLLLLLGVCSVALYARLLQAPLGTGSQGAAWGSWFLVGAVVVAGLHLAAGADVGATALVFGAGVAMHLLLERLRQRPLVQLPDLESLQNLIGSLGLVGAALLVLVREGPG